MNSIDERTVSALNGFTRRVSIRTFPRRSALLLRLIGTSFRPNGTLAEQQAQVANHPRASRFKELLNGIGLDPEHREMIRSVGLVQKIFEDTKRRPELRTRQLALLPDPFFQVQDLNIALAEKDWDLVDQILRIHKEKATNILIQNLSPLIKSKDWDGIDQLIQRIPNERIEQTVPILLGSLSLAIFKHDWVGVGRIIQVVPEGQEVPQNNIFLSFITSFARAENWEGVDRLISQLSENGRASAVSSLYSLYTTIETPYPECARRLLRIASGNQFHILGPVVYREMDLTSFTPLERTRFIQALSSIRNRVGMKLFSVPNDPDGLSRGELTDLFLVLKKFISEEDLHLAPSEKQALISQYSYMANPLFDMPNPTIVLALQNGSPIVFQGGYKNHQTMFYMKGRLVVLVNTNKNPTIDLFQVGHPKITEFMRRASNSESFKNAEEFYAFINSFRQDGAQNLKSALSHLMPKTQVTGNCRTKSLLHMLVVSLFMDRIKDLPPDRLEEVAKQTKIDGDELIYRLRLSWIEEALFSGTALSAPLTRQIQIKMGQSGQALSRGRLKPDYHLTLNRLYPGANHLICTPLPEG